MSGGTRGQRWGGSVRPTASPRRREGGDRGGRLPIVGIALAILACVAVMIWVGVRQISEIGPSMQHREAERAQGVLGKLRADLAPAWRGWERQTLDLGSSTVAGASPPVAHVRIERDWTVSRPAAWPGRRGKATDVGEADEEGWRELRHAEILEFSGEDPAGAASVYERLARSDAGVELRTRARLAAADRARKDGDPARAARHYEAVLQDPVQTGIEPWKLAVAGLGLARCQLEVEDMDGARATLDRLAGDLLSRDPRAPLAGMSPARRSVHLDLVLELLEEHAPQLSAVWRQALEASRAADRLREALDLWVLPVLRRHEHLADQLRLALRVGDLPRLAVLHRRGDRWDGFLVDPEDAPLTGTLERAQAAGFEVTLEGSWRPRSRGSVLGSMPLFPDDDTLRLVARPVDPAALDRAVERRQILLVTLLGLAAIVVLAGTALGLQRLSREMGHSRLKTELLSRVSHDLRTPLSLIRSSAETLRMGRAGDAESMQRYLDLIVRETVRLDGLVGNILHAARLEMGGHEQLLALLEPQELLDDVESSRRLFLEEQGFVLLVEIEDDLPPVLGDRESLRSALYNLVENAVKYSDRRKEITLQATQRDDRVVLSVLDRGRGVPESERQRIVERFYRAPGTLQAAEGVGLGLSLVMATARFHGGTLEVTSRPGGGAGFSLVLPVADPGRADS